VRRKVEAASQVSIQCACSVLRAERSSCHYKGKRRPQAVLMKRIKEIAETRVRYGGRRIRVQSRREGWRVNTKRVLRLCREIALQLRNRMACPRGVIQFQC
jgi:putative transposase